MIRPFSVLAFALAIVPVACGDDDSSSTPMPDAGSPDASAELDGAAPDASADASTAPDGTGSDAAAPGEVCPPPPADLPTDIEITEDGRFRYLDRFRHAGLQPRTVTVYLPADYDSAPDRRYPVVYLIDGNVSFAGGLRADAAMDDAVARGLVEPHLIVGIHSTRDRTFELTPDEDLTPPPDFAGRSGGGEAFAELVVETIKPFIDATFRTRCGRTQTAIGGYSLGGLMCLFMLQRDPDVFGRGLCMSASYWWNDGTMMSAFDSFSGPLPDRLWIDVGTGEHHPPPEAPFDAHMVDNARIMRDLAIAKGMTLGDDLGYLEDLGVPHAFDAAAPRFPFALAFVLGEGARPIDSDAATFELHLFDTVLAVTPADTTFSTSSVSVERRWGDDFRLTLPNRELTLSSSMPDVATVDRDGTITAVDPGMTSIEAMLGTPTSSAVLEVTD